MIAAGAPIEVFDEIDSTMLEARRRADRGELTPVWLVARVQSAGRGRRGRTWASLDGNLMTTYLAVTKQPPQQLALLGFAAGLAIADAIDTLLGSARAKLKWPNDILVDRAKIAGLMLDSGASWMALGFGVNLAAAPSVPDQMTTSLRTLLPPDVAAPEPLDFLARVRPRLADWAATLESGFEQVRNAWLARAEGLGAAARVIVGDAVIEGRIAGLSPRGELELDTSDGRRTIAAGDVLLSPSQAA
jgi:BirA family transcriptional regulator, biotin operon repressor / biotin---[acetyl-CoA-carboxylase] ligase